MVESLKAQSWVNMASVAKLSSQTSVTTTVFSKICATRHCHDERKYFDDYQVLDASGGSLRLVCLACLSTHPN